MQLLNLLQSYKERAGGANRYIKANAESDSFLTSTGRWSNSTKDATEEAKFLTGARFKDAEIEHRRIVRERSTTSESAPIVQGGENLATIKANAEPDT